MKEGVIIKGIGGFYDVLSNNEIYRCRARGKFRKQKITPMVGDHVRFTPETEISEGSLEEIYPRKNSLRRPAVANITNLAVVMSAFQPEPDLLLIDKLIISAERMNISILLVVNKIDLATQDQIDELLNDYKPSSYPIYCVSSKYGQGMEELARGLEGITTLAGQSGVGKSSIINHLHPSFEAEVGDVSVKHKRGRHTTRHVELLNLPEGGMIVDTPGFSQMELADYEEVELQEYYPEYEKYRHDCYFNGCIHVSEPNCKVQDAVEKGELPSGRYQRYVHFIKEIKEYRRNAW
ncbi:MAG: ribosome small subunit-dependent GTPase A [Clostridiales bacterium]|nr:ribosome small subunit-dependent GTPase A [Clostridiales bacterium]